MTEGNNRSIWVIKTNTMRSKIAKRILDKTPKEVEIFARMYGDLVVRINSLLKEKVPEISYKIQF